MRHLYRSRSDKYIAGILGGFGAFFRVDSTIIRAVYVLLTIFTGFVPGIIAYVVLFFIIPEEGSTGPWWRKQSSRSDDDDDGRPPFRPWS